MGLKDLPNVPLGFLLVRPEELAAVQRDPEWCANVDVKRLFNGDAERAVAALPIPAFKPSSFDRAMAEAVQRLQRENPPPPDALLPDGCSRWWPRVDVDERDGKMLARMTWEAKP